MPIVFQEAADLLHYLDSLNFFHMDLSLSRIEHVLSKRGLLRPPFLVVQVVGTNGKGSIATLLASLLQSYGCKVGLYTSPHFVSPAERIQINGIPLPEGEWLRSAEEALALSPDLTYFELLTAIALELFQERQVDIAILEAGLGAQHDATTACVADCISFAPIDLDHTAIIGPSLEDIARDKSFAIRSSAPVVSSQQGLIPQAILDARAKAYRTVVQYSEPIPANYPLGLLGEHQRYNAGTAVLALRQLLPLLAKHEDEKKTKEGLAHAFIPGRLQSVNGLLLDGAHNPHGMTSLTQYLATHIPPKAVVYSCLADKDWQTAFSMLRQAVPENTPFFIPTMDNSRAEKAENICAVAQTHCFPCSHLQEALRRAKKREREGAILVTGSLYLLAELFALYPQLLQRNAYHACV